ncbi:hypothetical protein EJB05_39279, partial [Eragrostis curvula]
MSIMGRPVSVKRRVASSAAVNAVFAKLGQTASSAWNISGDPCTGAATDGTAIDDNPNFNPAIKCECTDQNNTVCHVTRLKIYALNAVGQIPEELRNLTRLTNLDLRQNYLTGPLPSFLGELTAMQYMSLGINALSGSVPKELGNLTNLVSLGFGSNYLNGSLPSELGNLVKLEQLYIDSAGLSGPLPESFSKLTRMKTVWASDNDFTGQIPDYIGSWTNLTELRFQGNSFQGPLPTSLSNLVQLTSLRLGDIVNGSSSLAFISNLTSLNTLVLRNCKISDTLASVNFSKFANLNLLDLSFNNITGQIPQALLNLNLLNFLFLGNNSLSGSLPSSLGASLKNLDFSYNQLSGSFPSWANENNLQLNLVANNFVINNSNRSILPPGLECLQRNTPCFLGSPQSASFAVDCGSGKSISGSDNSVYQPDDASLGPASYYVTGATTWGISNVGRFMDASNGSYIIYSSRQFPNSLDSELFQTARMSPSSLRYYGVGLENGNYTVTLQFAEFDFEDSQTWKSVGKRVFDIYIQGERKEQNFDIRKEAGGKSYTAVKKQYTIPVTKNFLEIHLFWAGKGTCCIPTQGYYGPAISALSATPNFKPTVRSAAQKKSSNKTGVVVGVVVGAVVLGLVALAGFLMWRKKRGQLSLEQQELYSIVGRPNVFSYGELRTATDNFSSINLLGEGGYGSVFKGKLTDGRVVAVKQLSETSHQGKKEFATEIETISRVQHRNLVKLFGCCLEGNKPLLVYEYLENGSLDKALFGRAKLNLDWSTRFEICLGIARGLAYLHEESSIRVVHRDIKASNVLLDANLNPKISDFGLAKLYDDKKTHVSTKVAGTFGYLAPEYAMRGHMTEKVDVFAFGVVVLETLAGRPNFDNTLDEDKVYILEWAWQLYEEKHPLDMVDPKLAEFNGDEVLRAIHVALLCTQGSPHQRPSMSRAVSMLTGDVEVWEVVNKPSYITEWQIKGGNTSSFMSSDVSGQSSAAPRTASAQTSSPFLSSVIDEGRFDIEEWEGEMEMKPPRLMSCSSFLHGAPAVPLFLLLLLCCSWRAAAQAHQVPQTDPVEAAAVNAILSKLGLSAPASWNISGNPCSGAATDDTPLDDNPAFNPAIKCDCSDQNNTLCHEDKHAGRVGPIPEELRNLTHLKKLDFRKNYFTGPLPAFIGELTALEFMTVGINALSGPLPKELGNLKNLKSLALGSNNFNGTLPVELGNLTKLQQIYMDSNDFSGPLPSTLSQLKNLSVLWASDNNFSGQIPDYLGSLTNLTQVRIGDIVNGSSTLAFIGNMTSLGDLVLRNCKISDTIASVDFSQFGILNLLDFSYNHLSGSFPSWATQKNLQLNLVANDFVMDSSNDSVLPWGLKCLQRNTPCFLAASFAVDCGGSRTISGSDNSMYQADNSSLGSASYYVAGAPTWGVSSVGRFMDPPNGSYIIYSSRQFQNTLDSALFQTARMSPSSLRYYGIGLENGNYTITLQFAEVDFPDIQSWRSRGRRIFDIYVQGERMEQNFDIRKAAGGKSFTVVKKQYVVPVTKNFLEIHLFWAGKGTCCIPTQGYYGPAISALSATPNFTPTVHSSAENKSSKRTSVIVGVAVSISVFALIALAVIYVWSQKRRKLLLELEELYSIVGRPNVFSYSELSGYLAPEYAMRGHMTEKVDVFAFGVVALEIVAGESNYQNSFEENTTYIFERVWELFENNRPLDFVDPKLTEFNGDEVLRVIRVALHCTQSSPHRRPCMSKVVSMLAGDADMTEELTKPSYITEWQVKVGSGSGSFASTQVGSSSTQPSSGVHGGVQDSPGPGEVTPVAPSPMFTSVIGEG